MSAEPPQALSTPRPMEADQEASLARKQAVMASAHKKMEPTMNDMMKIAERCGEACIQKAIVEYGSSMQMTPELQSAKNDIVAASKQATELISSSSHTSSAGRPMGLVPLLPADCIEILAIGLMQTLPLDGRRLIHRMAPAAGLLRDSMDQQVTGRATAGPGMEKGGQMTMRTPQLK